MISSVRGSFILRFDKSLVMPDSWLPITYDGRLQGSSLQMDMSAALRNEDGRPRIIQSHKPI